MRSLIASRNICGGAIIGTLVSMPFQPDESLPFCHAVLATVVVGFWVFDVFAYRAMKAQEGEEE